MKKRQFLLLCVGLSVLGWVNAQEQIIENFEGSGPKSVMNAISGGTVSIVANPSKSGINTSDSVGMLVIDALHDPWVGFWVSRRTDNSPADSAEQWINAVDNRYVHVMVYKDAPSNLKFKLEGSWRGTFERYATTPDSGKNSKINEWEDIVIDFSDVPAYYPIWLLSPYWDRTEAGVVYFDNIVINNNPNPITANSVVTTRSHKGLIELYPNPVTDKLIIKNAVRFSRIVITNVLGEQVMQVNNLKDNAVINTHSLQSGLYLLIAYDSDGVAGVAKFFKK